MKKINVTFSLPEDTHKLMQSLIGQRKMSYFVTKAINNALIEKMNLLKKAYKEAEKDPDRKSLINDWKKTDVEGWE